MLRLTRMSLTRMSYLSGGAQLIGFTLTGGSLSGTNCGAGAYVDEGCLISDCVITDNQAASCTNTLMPGGKGGGLYLHGTALRCTIEYNSAWKGGGAYLESGANLADCEIRGNGAGYDVGGVEGVNGYGGGLYLEETASAVNCLIENNTATDGGGLFFDHGGYAQDIDSLTNEVDSIGGAGAFLWAGGTLRNGVIEGNISTGQYARGGSGILFYDAGGLVDNSVVADNISSTNNGGINFRYSGDTAPSKLGTVNNSIIWGNLPNQTTVWNGSGNQLNTVDPDTASNVPTGANVDDYPYDNALTRKTSYFYDLNGNLVKRVYPSRVVETRTFDALNRLLTMKTETLGKSWFKTEYEYDRVGSMLKRSHTRSDSLSGKAFAATTYWTYDSRYRLLSERIYVTGEPSHFTYYTWDNADNRLTKRVFRAIQTENITYTNNALNQITGWYDSLANSGAGKTVSYVYDNNGNRTSKTVTVGGSSTSTTYVYDYDNRLTSTSGSILSAFKYDYRSRRYYRSTPTETNLCVFDGGLCVQEYDASVNLTPHVSRLTTEYLRGPDLGGGVGGMVYSIDHRQSEIGNPIYSHSNHRGDVIARTDGTGSLTWFAIYEAYGTRPFEWGTNLDRQKANTKDEEAELGLLNEGMRYRDLETGTFLTRDPIRYADGPNMYCYVHCNPITSFDAWGLSKKDLENAVSDLNSAQERLDSFSEEGRDEAFKKKEQAARDFARFKANNPNDTSSLGYMNMEFMAERAAREADEYQSKWDSARERVEKCAATLENEIAKAYEAIAREAQQGTWDSSYYLSESEWSDARFCGKIQEISPYLCAIDAIGEKVGTYTAYATMAWMGVGLVSKGGEAVTGLDKYNKFRRTAYNLKEQLAMGEARAGAGSPLNKLILNEKRFQGMIKMQHVRKFSDGSKAVIHYVKDNAGNLMDFKFK